MSKAVTCPVCFGTGKVDKETCHGCGGKGWVEVAEDNPIPYYPNPYPTYIPPIYPNPNYDPSYSPFPYTGDPLLPWQEGRFYCDD